MNIIKRKIEQAKRNLDPYNFVGETTKIKSKIILNMEYGQDLQKLSSSIMPIGLNLLKQLSKEDLILIILTREKTFYELREDYLKIAKENIIDAFQFRRLDLTLTHSQDELISENLKLFKQTQNLIRTNKEYKRDELKLKEIIYKLKQ